MARKARKDLNTNVFSITQQANKKVFETDNDRDVFIELIEQTQKKFDFLVYAYCLLDDYSFKLIINAKKQSISKIMQSLIVSYMHHRKNETKLFYQRFKSKPLYTKEEVIAEIHNVNVRSKTIYNSYCVVNNTLSHSIDWLTSVDEQPIDFIKSATPASEHQLQNMVDDFLKEHNCDMMKIKDDKKLRNECIVRLRKQTNCSLKQIGYILGGLSESTISKILKNIEQEG